MSKYDALWEHIKRIGGQSAKLSFEEIQAVLGFEIDHSFLNYKKELLPFGWRVGKISLKGKTVEFVRTAPEDD